VHQLELHNHTLNAKGKQRMTKDLKLQMFILPNQTPTKFQIEHYFPNLVSSPVFVHFEQSSLLWVHQEEVHNTFWNSKGKWALSMDFKLFQN
jgi:hypothetical protein